MTKFIFITGGVISSLGKGIAAASIAAILKSRGINVTFIKLDPYINVDPGTMSPFQHGEVYVTHDGAETDLDLGHYERFTNQVMSKNNNFTTGQVYENVITKERRGDYLGATVQVIPHITDEIKRKIHQVVNNAQVSIIEVGGTVGDIESLPFLEAIRQMRIEFGEINTLYVHLSFVPFIPSAGEIKTKPTQRSVKELREIGIQPDILICRMDRILPKEQRKKIALFCNVLEQDVIGCYDTDSIYKIPKMLHNQGIDKIICEQLQLNTKEANLSVWDKIVYSIEHPKYTIKLGIIGKYVDLTESYKSLTEALKHAGIHTETRVDIEYIDSELIEQNGTENLNHLHAILIPGGFGYRGVEGKILAIKYARIKKIPFLGICLGMQLAIIEFARNIANLHDANSTEFNPNTTNPVIALINEWKNLEGKLETRNTNKNLGGTMRLGAQTCYLKDGSLAKKIYNSDKIEERHRHRYEFNNNYLELLSKKGLFFSGVTDDEYKLVEIIELNNHPWFFACQFHPEFTSTPIHGHPLFINFITATLKKVN